MTLKHYLGRIFSGCVKLFFGVLLEKIYKYSVSELLILVQKSFLVNKEIIIVILVLKIIKQIFLKSTNISFIGFLEFPKNFKNQQMASPKIGLPIIVVALILFKILKICIFLFE